MTKIAKLAEDLAGMSSDKTGYTIIHLVEESNGMGEKPTLALEVRAYAKPDSENCSSHNEVSIFDIVNRLENPFFLNRWSVTSIRRTGEDTFSMEVKEKDED